MKITLNKALKLKNKLVNNISKLAIRIQTNNSYQLGNTPTYNSQQMWENYLNETGRLIELKAAINQANQRITEKIITIGELKSRITVLNGIDTTQGERSDGYRSAVSVRYTATISEEDRDKLIEATQMQLEHIQDEIDKYNATTEIEVE